MAIKFYKYIDVKTLCNLVNHYKKNVDNLKEICLCINYNKFYNSTASICYDVEIGNNIKIITIEGIRITILLSNIIEYDLIETFPIYYN